MMVGAHAATALSAVLLALAAWAPPCVADAPSVDIFKSRGPGGGGPTAAISMWGPVRCALPLLLPLLLLAYCLMVLAKTLLPRGWRRSRSL
jgi:hypothetical protein